jgi:hypothetical protein
MVTGMQHITILTAFSFCCSVNRLTSNSDVSVLNFLLYFLGSICYMSDGLASYSSRV